MMLERWLREQRRAERPGHPDSLSDKAFPTHADALVFAQMEARWHGAKLIDQTGGAK